MTTEATVLLDAAFASYAEGPDAPEGYVRSSTVITNHEGLHVEIYQRKDSQDYIVSFRGTDQASNDIATDLNLGWPQYHESRDKIMIEINGLISRGGSIALTGHSLGGALAQFAAYDILKSADYKKRAQILNQVSLTTWNALGGVWGLERNGGFDPKWVEGLNARHYYRADDLVVRLGKDHVGGEMLRLNDPQGQIARIYDAHMDKELSESLKAGTITKADPWYFKTMDSSQVIAATLFMVYLGRDVSLSRRDILSILLPSPAIRGLHAIKDALEILGCAIAQELYASAMEGEAHRIESEQITQNEVTASYLELLNYILHATQKWVSELPEKSAESIQLLKESLLELGHILIAANTSTQGNISELQIWEREQRFADDLAAVFGGPPLGHCLPGLASLDAYSKTLDNVLRQLGPGFRCPLVLDLDGDGVRTLALGSAGVRFDLNADGSPEACGWIASTEALLVRDRNGDGRIDSGLELFGDHTLLRDGTRAAHGFAALADLDSNRDGQIDARDAAWGELALWRDANSNGSLDAGEWLSLSSQSITALELAFAPGSGLDAQGNDLRLAGHYRHQDGSRRLLADVWLATGATATLAQAPISAQASVSGSSGSSGSAIGSAWATIGGTGTVPGLQQALQADSSGRLEHLLNQWLQADSGQRQSLLADIALHWAGVADLPSAAGQPIDARIVAALHAYTNNRFQNSFWDLSDERTLTVLRESFQALCRQIGTLLEARQILSPLWSRAIRLDAQGQPELNPSGFELALQDQLSRSATDEQLVAAGQLLRSHALVGGVLMQGLHARAMENLLQPDRRLWLLQRAKRQPSTDSWFWSHEDDELIEVSMAGTVTESGGGDDVVLGTDRADVIQNVEGHDLILALGGDDTISSDTRLINSDGRATIIPGAGNDSVNMVRGNHTLIHNRGDGYDSLIGDARNGTYELVLGQGINANELRFVRSGADLSLEFVNPGQGIRLVNLFAKPDFIESACALRRIRFSDGSSWTLEDLKDRLLRGDAGDNQITGFSNHDRIWGEAGHDGLFGRDGNDTLLGGSGNDSLNGDAGSDLLDGGDGDDVLTVRTVGGEDTLLGGAGRNQFIHYRGNALLAANPTGSGTSSNTLELPLIAPENVVLERQGNELKLSYNNVSLAGSSTIRVEDFFRDFTVLNRWNPLQFISFGSGIRWDARTVASRFSNALMGTSADNRLSGRDSDDWLDGMEGHDSLQGLAGHDTLQGGSGNDTLIGGAGNDLLIGSDGLDTASWAGTTTAVRLDLSLSGPQDSGAGLDTLQGIEHLVGGSSHDRLLGDESANRLEGADGDDTLDGGGGNDTLSGGNHLNGDTASYARAGSAVTVNLALTTAQNTGGAGSDLLSGIEHLIGSAHGDSLFGSSGANRLQGGGGNDTLQGGLGVDTLVGGDGSDWFLVASPAEAGNGSGSRDWIADLGAGDRLDLSAIDARSDQTGNQAFLWIGSAAFSALGQLRYTRLSNGNGLLEGNCTGNLAADFQLELIGAPDLANGAAVLL